MAHARNSDTVAKLLRELSEPRPNGQPCIAWLGEIEAKERLVRVCARRLIALNTKYELLQH